MIKSNAKLNYLYSTAYSILNMLLPLITSPYISRVVGAEGLGIYSYNYSIANYFMLFAMMGINNYGNRNIAKVRDNREELDTVFSEMYSMQLMLSSVMLFVYCGYVLFFVKENRLIAFIQILMVASPAVTVSWFFMGIEQFKITVTRNFIVKLLTFVSIFVFVRNRSDLWKYTLIMAIGFLISEGSLLLYINRFVTYKRVGLSSVLQHFKPNVVLFVPVLAVSVYRTMDRIMLKELSTYAQVGFYTNAEKIINICLSFITALGQVMLPKMSNLIAKGNDSSFFDLIRKSLKFVSALTIAMSFGIYSIADIFVPIFFGTGYEPCINILKLLAINLPLLAWGNVIKTQYLIPKEADYIYIKAVSLGLIVNLIINLSLIRDLQAIGAVIGTIAAEMISLFYILYKTRIELDLKTYIKEFVPYIFFGFIMIVSIKGISLLHFKGIPRLLAQIGIGGLSFAVSTLLYWVATDDEFLTYLRRNK